MEMLRLKILISFKITPGFTESLKETYELTDFFHLLGFTVISPVKTSEGWLFNLSSNHVPATELKETKSKIRVRLGGDILISQYKFLGD